MCCEATTQHHFINMSPRFKPRRRVRRYVSLCVKLHKWLMENMEMAEPETLDSTAMLHGKVTEQLQACAAEPMPVLL